MRPSGHHLITATRAGRQIPTNITSTTTHLIIKAQMKLK